MRDRADLHIHSTASDGYMTPTEVIEEAARLGLGAVSLTDHDTVAGLAEAQDVADRLCVEFVPGVEINTDYGNTEVHILGYFIDPASQILQDGLARLRAARLDRGARIVGRLQNLGVRVTMDRVMEIAGSASLGRPHIARAICETGVVDGMNSAFGRYLVRGAPAFVPRSKLCATEAIGLVRSARGVACLAHPGKIGSDRVLPEFVEAGLDAIEVWHTDHSRDVSKRYLKLADRHGLIPTGGADSHGLYANKPVQIGSVTVDLESVVRLRAVSRRDIAPGKNCLTEE